jgi:hypothetical protein
MIYHDYIKWKANPTLKYNPKWLCFMIKILPYDILKLEIIDKYPNLITERYFNTYLLHNPDFEWNMDIIFKENEQIINYVKFSNDKHKLNFNIYKGLDFDVYECIYPIINLYEENYDRKTGLFDSTKYLSQLEPFNRTIHYMDVWYKLLPLEIRTKIPPYSRMLIRKKPLCYKLLHKWLYKTRRNIEQRFKNKIFYESVLDMLRLRIRDINYGLRKKMI